MSHNLEAILLLIKGLNANDLAIVQTRLNYLLYEQNGVFPNYDVFSNALLASNRVPEEDNYDNDSVNSEIVTRYQLDQELDEMERERNTYYKLRDELSYHFKLI